MASEPIHIHDDSELPRILDEATERPVRFERKGVVYLLSTIGAGDIDEDIWEGYDPEAVIAALDEVSGRLSPEEAEEMIEYIYEGRRLGSRPANRP